MLIISIILAAILLAAANGIAYHSRHPGTLISGLCLVFFIGPALIALFSIPVLLLCVLLPCAEAIWKVSSRGPSFFRSLSLGAGAIAFGISGIGAYLTGQNYARLRIYYPFESMETRLPVPKPANRLNPLSQETLSRLDEQENSFGWLGYRTIMLERLHQSAVEQFVNSFGFGFARIPHYPTESNLASYRNAEPVPLQPGIRLDFSDSPGDWRLRSALDEKPLDKLHIGSVRDFADPTRFGYFKDRRHVSGFEAHRFSKTPESDSPHKVWTVQTLDLVGLLLHDEPRVYVSAHLPAMNELREAPTRPLDKFEAISLKSLQSGDSLVIVRDRTAIRMLGAIRNLKQCINCHAGERGDLLGAFSYTLNTANQSPLTRVE